MAEQEMFRATGGQATGIGGLVLAAAMALFAVTSVDLTIGFPLLAVAFLLAVLTYAAVLRPRVGLSGTDLVLQQMFGTTRIPLAAIQDVSVRQTAIFRVEGKKYDTPALSRRRIRGISRLRNSEPEQTVCDLQVDRITTAMADARKRDAVAEGSDEQAALAGAVRQEWSRPMITLTLLGVLAVFLAVVL